MAVDRLRGAFQMSRSGKVLAAGAAGPQDDPAGALCSPETCFQAASVSKNLVAASMTLLCEKGTLSLADPVKRWWPKAPGSWESMTVSHLLSHSAGIGHWSYFPGLDIHNPPPPEVVLEQAAELPLRRRPGTVWEYGGIGYLLAAAISETASNQPYSEFVADNIFRPLGMSSTTSGVTRRGRGVADGHTGGQPTPVIEGLSALPGTGDLWTTVGDLTRYATAVHKGELISASSWRSLTHRQMDLPTERTVQDPVDATAYGYGTYVGTISGQSAWFHTGDNPGFRSFLAWLPDSDLTVAMLCNDESVAFDEAVPRILGTIDAQPVLPRPPT
ncbi:MAG: serine hydrolase domain-containing protein [Candidatus Dormiibacterota bacterium]